jgi:hypothetical protein
MADDYLGPYITTLNVSCLVLDSNGLCVRLRAVRSGAKELLARAIASLLAVRPANAVAFLAQQYTSPPCPRSATSSTQLNFFLHTIQL